MTSKRTPMTDTTDNLEWLRRFSQRWAFPTERPVFDALAEELEALRAELERKEERIAAVLRAKLSNREDEPWFDGWNAAVEELRRVAAYPDEPPPAEYS